MLSVLVLGEGSFRLFRSALAAPSRKLFEALDINSVVDFSAWLDHEQPKNPGAQHYCNERYKDCFHDLCSKGGATHLEDERAQHANAGGTAQSIKIIAGSNCAYRRHWLPVIERRLRHVAILLAAPQGEMDSTLDTRASIDALFAYMATAKKPPVCCRRAFASLSA